MKTKDLKEIKNKSADALKKEIEKLLREKNEAKIERDMNKGKNVHKILTLKKNIAQIKTILMIKSFQEKSHDATERSKSAAS